MKPFGLAVVAVVALATGAPAQSGAANHCRIAGTRLVAQSPEVVVLARDFSAGPGSTDVWGCQRSSGNIVRMASVRNGEQLTIARAAGHFAAIAVSRDREGPIGLIAGGVREANLKIGHLFVADGAAGHPWDAIGGLVLRPSGSMAWIAGTSSMTVEVRKRQAGHQVVLDSGSGIAFRSLRLRGTRLTWVHDGARRHATLL